MLQNRVDPIGNLIKTSARGAWMGNRGILHSNNQEIVRPYRLTAWITCKLEFNGRKRTVMAPDRYTELFFMDEATAFSAGHRPCFECRRSDFKRFKSYWLKGNPGHGFDEYTPMNKIDAILQGERINRYNLKVTFTADSKDIPEGTFVLLNGDPYVVSNGLLHLWTASGYTTVMELADKAQLSVLTPRSIVSAFSAGYHPQIAIS